MKTVVAFSLRGLLGSKLESISESESYFIKKKDVAGFHSRLCRHPLALPDIFSITSQRILRRIYKKQPKKTKKSEKMPNLNNGIGSKVKV